jgi:hypothetical protein
MSRSAGLITALVTAGWIVAAASAQTTTAPDAATDRRQPGQSARDAQLMRRELYQALAGATVSVDLAETPARGAFDRLRKALDIPLIGRYRDDSLGFGLDPEVVITLEAADRPALEVLEEMLAQCSAQGAACTWQIRKGFIEFGTKARLSVPAARDTRTYYVADLIVDIPDDPNRRTRRELNALDVVQDICETVEPGQWDYGQGPDQEDEELLLDPGLARRSDPQPAPAEAKQPDADQARRQPATPPRRYVRPTRIAIIRYWRDVVIVHAPDYIHRQINGYPGLPSAEQP